MTNPTVLSRLATEARDAEGALDRAATDRSVSHDDFAACRRVRDRALRALHAAATPTAILSLLSDLARARAEAEVSFEERTRLREALFFFASVIRSGEPWSEQCDAAFSRATAPLHEIEADLVSHLASPEKP